MNKKALRKDFYMEIKKSLGRFLSMFFIVALGVAFFSGIRASEPDMRLSGDAYFDDSALMDIQVIGTLGLTADDVSEISLIKGVAEAEAAYSTDVLAEINDKQIVLHVMSSTENINQVTVSAGRLPEKANECLVDQDFLAASSYEIGDELTFTSGTENDLSDTMAGDKYKIVGSGSTAYYLSFERGSSMIGSGSVSGFVMVPAEAFCMEAYTEIYVQAAGARAEIAYTEGYDQIVDDVLGQIEEIAGERSEVRKAEIQEEISAEIAEARTEFAAEKTKAETELADAQVEIDDGEAAINEAWGTISAGWGQLAAGRQELISKGQELDDGQAAYNSGMAAYNQAAADLNSAQEKYNAGKPAAEQGFAAAEQELAVAREQLAGLQELYNQQVAIYGENSPEAGEVLAQVEAVSAGIAEGEAGLSSAKAEFAAAGAQLSAGWTQLAQSEAALSASAAQIADGKTKIAAGWSTLAQKEKELSAGEAELKVQEETLAAGKAKLEEAKAEAAEKLAEGEAELADAEAEVQSIETPKWYVKDRSVLIENTGFGENADRMRAIGQVFPVLFFLVAALISLTTMTRMVEEQRVQIGTLKALGYHNLSIAGKYLNYALFATLGGSVIGVLIGEKLFPFVIVNAYKIMYPNLPEILLPYHMSYAMMATVAALGCTLAATWIACYKELRAHPAVLMRPPAPLKGKRVLIEKVTFLWKRLTFIWKSTIRNLFRYKKRFFMTIFGIGSCMALMIVGYGIKDSIFEAAEVQYSELEHADATIYLGDGEEDAVQTEVYDYLNQNSDIKRYEKMLTKSITVRANGSEKDLYLYVPEEEEKITELVTWRSRSSHREYELTDDGVILTEKMAKTLDVSVGDKIIIEDQDNGDKEVTISQICENYIGHSLYMTLGQYQDLYQSEPEYNSILIQLKDYSEKQMQGIGEELLTYDEVLNVSYMKNIKSQVYDMLDSLNIVIVVLIISAGMLAFVVLYNLNNINITERKRELATIKVLGFYDGEVGAYVYRENVLLTLIGAGAGLILGKMLHQFIIVTVEVDTLMFGRNISLQSYLLSGLWTIGFSAIVNFAMYFKLKRINMIESLKSIE